MKFTWNTRAPGARATTHRAAGPMRIGVLLAVAMIAGVATQGNSRRDRFKPNGVVDNEGPANGGQNPTEAPAGFDNQTNGMDPQGPDYETLNEDTVVPLRSFNDNRFVFEEIETAGDGVGPTYNAQSCRECHQNVVTGGASQVAEHRTGHLVNGQFFESQGGSLVHLSLIHISEPTRL